jgi:broad specificity phosphatase PhoE
LQGHYRTKFPHTDPDITRFGEQQAIEAGRFFAQWLKDNNKKIGKVVVSPLLRTMRTAALFLEQLEYRGNIVLEPLVRETQSGCPSEQGSPRSELPDKIPAYLRDNCTIDTSCITEEIWYKTTAETAAEIEERLREAFNRYASPDQPDDEVTLVFSHGGVGMRMSGHTCLQNCEIAHIATRDHLKILFSPAAKPNLPPPPQPNKPF